MTLNEFVIAFNKVNQSCFVNKHRWQTKSNDIRYFGEQGCYCPITAVAYPSNGFLPCTSKEDTILAATRLGLSEKDANTIMNAADRESPVNATEYRLRKKLLNIINNS